MVVPMTKENGIRDDKKRHPLTRSLRTLTRLRRIQTRSRHPLARLRRTLTRSRRTLARSRHPLARLRRTLTRSRRTPFPAIFV